jgi:hypothetical protein
METEDRSTHREGRAVWMVGSAGGGEHNQHPSGEDGGLLKLGAGSWMKSWSFTHAKVALPRISPSFGSTVLQELRTLFQEASGMGRGGHVSG